MGTVALKETEDAIRFYRNMFKFCVVVHFVDKYTASEILIAAAEIVEREKAKNRQRG